MTALQAFFARHLFFFLVGDFSMVQTPISSLHRGRLVLRGIVGFCFLGRSLCVDPAVVLFLSLPFSPSRVVLSRPNLFFHVARLPYLNPLRASLLPPPSQRIAFLAASFFLELFPSFFFSRRDPELRLQIGSFSPDVVSSGLGSNVRCSIQTPLWSPPILVGIWQVKPFVQRPLPPLILLRGDRRHLFPSSTPKVSFGGDPPSP